MGYLVSGLLLLYSGVRFQVFFTAAKLLGSWALLVWVPPPGHPAGTLRPDANLPLAIDEFVPGRFRDGTSYAWVLSGMTFSATVLLGVSAEYALRSQHSQYRRFLMLTVLGLASLAAGWVLAERLGCPIIKHLWTSSMTLWAAGWSYLLMALFYLLIDVWAGAAGHFRSSSSV